MRVCVTDPENSAYFAGRRDDNLAATDKGSRIEGIGRPRVEPWFLFPMANRMIRVYDAASVAAMQVEAEELGACDRPRRVVSSRRQRRRADQRTRSAPGDRVPLRAVRRVPAPGLLG